MTRVTDTPRSTQKKFNLLREYNKLGSQSVIVREVKTAAKNM